MNEFRTRIDGGEWYDFKVLEFIKFSVRATCASSSAYCHQAATRRWYIFDFCHLNKSNLPNGTPANTLALDISA
jgi:hypothetical protein